MENPQTGQICPISYSADPRCTNFSTEVYGVSILAYPCLSATDALDHWRTQLTPDIFDNVHNGNIYHVWANGMTSGLTFGTQFQDSFQFTS